MSERDTSYPASSGFSASTESSADSYDSPDASRTAEYRTFAGSSDSPDASRSTAEVRAFAGSSDSPDASGSTAQFRAFASRPAEAESPWSMRAPGRKVGMLALWVAVVAVVLALIAVGVINA
jgi:hypothetical protein